MLPSSNGCSEVDMRAFSVVVLGGLLLSGCDASEALATTGAIVAALLPLASLITGLTKTPKDDAVLAKILPFLSFLQPKDAPGTLKLPLTKPAE